MNNSNNCAHTLAKGQLGLCGACGKGMSDWVVWVEREEGYLLDTAIPDVVTSYAWHAAHYSESDAKAIADFVGGKALRLGDVEP